MTGAMIGAVPPRSRTELVGRQEELDRVADALGWGDGGEWDRAYAYFDRAWGNVLGNLKKRWENGPVDWAPWLEQLRKLREAAAAASAPAR